MKSIIAAGLLLGASAPAFAGPYANVENNAAWSGFDHEAAVTEVHAGYEFQAGEDVAIYVQGGPAFIAVDGEVVMTRDTTTATPTTPRSQKKSSPKKPAANVPAAKPKSTFAAAIAQARRNNPSLEFGK